MNDTQKYITIKGAKENNLKNINLVIPKNKFIVFSGVSGSGKSSLAFNTIYEEGRRRYVDSLSSYARQFLGNAQKPLVDSIEGLSPAISIEQKTTHNNPRSTVGTITEIYDYLRLLYARVGVPFCPKHNIKISSQKIPDIVNNIFSFPKKTHLTILASVVRNEKGSHQKLFSKLRHEGFLRVRVDGEFFSLDSLIKLEKNKKHSIAIVVDNIVLSEDERDRITEAVELALEYGKGEIIVSFGKNQEKIYSKFHSCPHNDFNMPTIEHSLFSFNSPVGMCKDCKGLGIKLKVNIKKLIPDSNLSIMEGGIEYFKNLVNSTNLEWQQFKFLCDYYGIDLYKKLKDFSDEEMNIILHGSSEPIKYTLHASSGNKHNKYEFIEGIVDKIERKHLYSSSETLRDWYRKKFMSDINCSKCNGARLNQYALAVKMDNMNIYEFTRLSIEDALKKVQSLKLSEKDTKISKLIVNELINRLSFLNNVGLGYISLERKAETLSGGESQRIKLATQIGSNLTGVLYVLDEPSIGLHQKDNKKLIAALKKMVNLGNTLIVVEHDEETIRSADHIVDLGPEAGEDGGEVVANGSVQDIMNADNSLTGDYLSGRKKINISKTRRSGTGKVIELLGANHNNLKGINVKFPLGKFIAITGVSGSGKSSLINDVFVKAVKQKLSNPFLVAGKFSKIKGINHINKIVRISQSPIGRTPRSNPATYTGVFTDIREAFANIPLAKARGYSMSRFSFNVDGGRCDNCRGDGLIKVEMHFLPNVYIKCDYCQGKRYNSETLDVKYKGKSIYDILQMKVTEAIKFFANHPKIKFKLQTLMDVGLGYITLGQNATTLSGGEAQRVKLATYLQKKPTGKCVYVLDEPTTGLHQHDVKKLLKVLTRLVDGKDTVIVIEHNLDVIKNADYIIDLGPEGGKNGGKIVASGTPEQVSKCENSFTGQYLKSILKKGK